MFTNTMGFKVVRTRTPTQPKAPKGPWGGRREGAGRPRIYATDAERSRAYRARKKQRLADEAAGRI